MNIFETHNSLVDNYKKYLSSFINVTDDRINEVIQNELLSEKLIPKPMIQFNPSFEVGGSISELVEKGVLHKEFKSVFKDFELYRHQTEAIMIGSRDQSFVVTSGTGSGKSLTFLTTIFNKIFNDGVSSEGVRAVIVYPMNALINSQYNALKEIAEKYQEDNGNSFPIEVGKYTGQEGESERDELRKKPPHILLTNYMMLELILTRAREREFVQKIYNNIDILVFDELHTYRGRQGADVAMLIRRIHAQAKNQNIICIGTSATMTSGGTIQEQRKEIAEVASKIFGKNIPWENVITEYLRVSFPGGEVGKDELVTCINNIINSEDSEEKLRNFPLARWLEQHIGLSKVENDLIRGEPLTLDEIVERLASASGCSPGECRKAVIDTLNWADTINGKIFNERPRRSYLPYKIHQFIAQTGSVYATLESPETRTITLEAKLKTSAEEGKLPMFQIVFSRSSGREFICVRFNEDESRVEPSEFNAGRLDDDEEDDRVHGYIIFDSDPENPVWIEPDDFEYLPDSWFTNTRSGAKNLRGTHKDKIPKRVYFDKYGIVSSEEIDGFYPGWFMAAPLAFDPTSKTTFTGGTRESSKLTRLGIEGRSTATTILSFLTISELAKELPYNFQKLLCFTDIRQDAALQAGHFNDFIKIGRLRSAIYHSLQAENSGTLDYKNIDDKVFQTLNLKQNEYAQVPADEGTHQYNENVQALKTYLSYRLLYDLRRGWRVILPNLEQVALLKIRYQDIEKEASREHWKSFPEFEKLPQDVKTQILTNTLDFFRSSFAFHFEIYDRHESNKKLINQNLKEPWTLDQNEKLHLPVYLRVVKQYQRKQNVYTQSIGHLSAYGKYLKSILKDQGIAETRGKDMDGWISAILDGLCRSGYLRKYEKLLDVPLYQLNGTYIIWELGDEKTPWQDVIRIRTHTEIQPRINQFFQDFYKKNYRELKPILAAEHTGQLNNEDRQKYEEEFIKGDVSALYCSPTMELGVDISELNVIQLRNVPPNPANYAQRSGRAGRSGQAALVVTYCANHSSHDRHYFEHRKEMIAGVVTPPKLDLTQEELIETHLNALYLAETGIESLNDSFRHIIDEDNLENLPLKPEVWADLNLSEKTNDKIRDTFNRVIQNIEKDLFDMPSPWYSLAWLNRKLKSRAERFNEAMNRWREIYKRSYEQLQRAGQIIGDPRIPRSDERKKEAENESKYAQRQIDLLKNEMQKGQKNNQLSEFYPYRYLAAEGFLPGYNFTRLPVRIFIPKKDGEYISRPRFIALREFGPHNIIYHSGGKYHVNQMLWSENDNPLVAAKIAKGSGYILMGGEAKRNICPITGADLSDNFNRTEIRDMIEIRESRAEPRERITCEEEERTILGYDITTSFYLEKGLDRIEEVLVKVDGDLYLRIQHFPAARIVQINNKWKTSKDGDGYLIGKKTGFWKKPRDLENRKAGAEEIQRVKLYSQNTADALYIQPTKNLNLNPFQSGVITLTYAIKRAIENVFQIEANELGASLMGETEEKNILIYESAEGSLGVLRQIVKEPAIFKKIIEEAYDLCHFNKSEEEQQQYGAASYADLLSFYNQRYHLDIDRYLIKECLEALMSAQCEVKRSSLFKDYDNQYEELKEQIDQTSSTEVKFLKHLYDNKLRLPDRAQVDMSPYGCYTKPDFMYHEDVKVCVFCDGTPHDDPGVKESDSIKRDCLENLGYEVLVWHYSQPLDEFVTQRQDIFKKVKE